MTKKKETLTCIECGEFFDEDSDIAAKLNEGQPGQATGWCENCDPEGAFRPAPRLRETA
jgi:hypothetical protein